MSSDEPTLDEFMSAAGSSSHDGSMPLDEYLAELERIHPAVMGKMLEQWADMRDEAGMSSAEHPHFRQSVRRVMEDWPEGYEGE